MFAEIRITVTGIWIGAVTCLVACNGALAEQKANGVDRRLPYMIGVKEAAARAGSRTPVFAPSADSLRPGEAKAYRDAGIPVVPWTVNDKSKLLSLMKEGVSGLISDRPDLLREAVVEFDADGDGKGGDYLDSDGLVVFEKFDAQGHRGGRDLRPENTLPAMEVCMDLLLPTLELDCVVTADGVAVLTHDATLNPLTARQADGQPYTRANAVNFKGITLADLQKAYIGDKLLPGKTTQKNDLALSPVSVAFAKAKGLPHPYVNPSLDQLFDFVAFYIDYYRDGAGKSHADAARRAKNADRIHYNVETKIDHLTVGVPEFVDAVPGAIARRGLEATADVQSFDFRTLEAMREKFPKIRAVYLFGNRQVVGDVKTSPSNIPKVQKP